MSTVTTISKGSTSAAISSAGAELTSLVHDGREYLWQADPAFWGRHAPVLFPIVGSIRNDCAESSEGPCHMGRHGVARINEHAVVDVAEDGSAVTFELVSNDDTRVAYPYDFKLNMTYAITDEGALAQTFRVENTGSVPLPFSVGGHPAFNIPVEGTDEAFEDYEFRFAKAWTADCPKLVDGGLADYEDAFRTVDGSDTLDLSRDLFRFDTMILDHVPGSTITLVGKKSGHGIRVDFEGFPFLGVWSAPGAPFVALEPWTGHTTATTEDDVLEHKENITILVPGAVDERTFTVTLL